MVPFTQLKSARPERSGVLWALLMGVLWLIPGAAHAQTDVRSARTRDSLIAKLREPAIPDTQRAAMLYQLCWELRQSDLAAARRYGEQGLAIARRTNYMKGELNCLAELSGLALSSEDYLRAEQLAQELVRRSAVAPPRLVRFRARGLESIATVATVQGQHERAAQYYRQQLAVVLANQPELSDLLPMAYLGLASAYYTQLQQGNTADSIVAQNRYYAVQAQRLARQQKSPLVEAASLQLLAMALKERKQLDSADRLMRQALHLYRANNATYNVGAALVEMAGLSLRLNRPTEAASLAEEARRIAQEVQDPYSEMTSNTILAAALAEQGQGMAAYRAINAARAIEDSVKTAENTESLHKLQVQFDTERKEGRIRELTQQQRLEHEKVARQRQGLWALGAVLAAVAAGLAVAALLALRLRRSRELLAARNRELELARASQDRLYAIVAHDLRGPVAAFQGLAPVIRYYRDRNDLQALDEVAGEVSVTADSLARLLDNLLHYATTQTGELRYRPEALPVAGLFREIVALYAPAARAAQVTLAVDVPADLTIQADRALTLTILRNLTHNALKVSPTGTTITLGAAPAPGGLVRLMVADQGPGLPAERVQELRAAVGPAVDNRAPDRPESGTGLGLPLVRQLVGQQGGEFELESAPGVGTVAAVTLPGAEEAEMARSRR